MAVDLGFGGLWHVLTSGRALLRKDTPEESEYAGLAGRRLVPPVAFVPRGVDAKRDQSPTPIQFRSRPRALRKRARIDGSTKIFSDLMRGEMLQRTRASR